jgi:hypothetical protein
MNPRLDLVDAHKTTLRIPKVKTLAWGRGQGEGGLNTIIPSSIFASANPEFHPVNPVNPVKNSPPFPRE